MGNRKRYKTWKERALLGHSNAGVNTKSPQVLKPNPLSSTHSSGSRAEFLVSHTTALPGQEVTCSKSHLQEVTLTPTAHLQLYALNCATEKQQLSLPSGNPLSKSRSSSSHICWPQLDLNFCTHCCTLVSYYSIR